MRDMGLTQVEKIIPGVRWLRGYNAQFAVADLIAGITVGLTVLPQGLAYATLAGLEPQYGLYSAFIGGLVYALMGGCREVTIGPTALLALMTSRHTGYGGDSGPQFAILLCFLAGLVELLMAVLRLGALVDLISLPVTVGFTSATALIIGASQLKALLGIRGGSGSGFAETIKTVIQNIGSARVADSILGLTAIAVLLALRKLKDIKTPAQAGQGRKALGMALWLIATARNALLVLVTSLLAFYFDRQGERPFILTGTVRSGIPAFNLPPFSTQISGPNNTSTELGFIEMTSELGVNVVLVPVIAVLGNVAISKAFGGSGINPTKELVALSLSNIFGSFFSSIPVTGSFSRSAVNHASGVKTPIGGIYTTALVLLALGLLTPYFQFIPKAALSAVIISAVIFMIEYEVIRPLWRCNKRELIPGAITFVLSLIIGVELGLLAGVLADLAFVVYRTARPILSVEVASTPLDVQYIIIRPRHSLLYFPAVEWVRNGISKAIKKHGNIPVVLDCRIVHEFDYTAATGLGALHKELDAKKIPLLVLGPSDEVRIMLRETLKSTMLEASTEQELESVLQGLNCESKKYELGEVVTPLLSQTTTDQAIVRAVVDE
ncbi:sodium-independent sulfate anion transporter [Topomyia yanbarensis]|uniref:sodium-independent sulfate anion transporter n=1 Tax=Topomyia yanbarensis TaxID=2498891 RepID=UPI00273ADE1D|nr:sodium-independent sulfate anion transporter [Topomyia yanbarensis]XP_058825059.1 sodium-independent sulfate anion transporter [Topomyia yanbarensis]XP_058825061.1 sodium-independent sulfate anion transporter [Topomyia yanbarensis]XP_058825062.1 sodium-independent sulfate anion transporter [Topomyia yanbarensis]